MQNIHYHWIFCTVPNVLRLAFSENCNSLVDAFTDSKLSLEKQSEFLHFDDYPSNKSLRRGCCVDAKGFVIVSPPQVKPS